MTLFDSYSWLCRRIDQKLLKYVSCSSFKWKQLLILSYLLKRTLVLLKVLPLSCIFAYTNLITHEFLYSSSSLLNESLLHDKLWGPSQRVVTSFSVTLHCSRIYHQEKKYNLYKPRPLEQLKWRRRRESKEISWFCLRCWRPGGQGGNRKGTEGISVPHQLGRGASGTWNARNCTGEELYFEVTLLARCRRCVAIFLGSC